MNPLLDSRRQGRGEMFEMHARRRPRRSSGRERFEHRRRAAAIELRFPPARRDEARQVEHTALFLVDMEVDTVTAGSKLVQKRRFAASPPPHNEAPRNARAIAGARSSRRSA